MTKRDASNDPIKIRAAHLIQKRLVNPNDPDTDEMIALYYPKLTPEERHQVLEEMLRFWRFQEFGQKS